MLLPRYVRINQNFSYILRIKTQTTTILIEKNFWNICQIARKTYIVCKMGQIWFCWDFEVLPPDQYEKMNSNFSPVKQIYTPNTTILAEIFENFPSFPGKVTFCAELVQKSFCWDFEVLPRLCDNQSDFQSYILHVKRYHSRQKEFSENFPSFPAKLTL